MPSRHGGARDHPTVALLQRHRIDADLHLPEGTARTWLSSRLGWGLGGGVVVEAAADDDRVRAVAAVNAIGDGARSTRAMHDGGSWRHLRPGVEADRGPRARTSRSALTAPWDIVRLDLDADTGGYVERELYRAPGSSASPSSRPELLHMHAESCAAFARE